VANQPWIEECPNCDRPFRVTGGRTGPIIDFEDITCPHCRHVCGRERIADVFITTPLSDQEEKDYLSAKTARQTRR